MKPTKFLRLPAVLEMTGLCRATVYGLIAKEQFPKPFRVTGKITAWSEAEVAEWQQARMVERILAGEAA